MHKAILFIGFLLIACVAKVPQQTNSKGTKKYFEPKVAENDTSQANRWTKIKVINNVSEASSKRVKGNIRVRFESTNPRTQSHDLEVYAIGQLKRKAAAIDGEAILITYKNVIIVYGEMPTIEMLADVY